MWKCPKCDRIFEKKDQVHSCKRILLEKHFKGKEKAKELFDVLLRKINGNIGKAKIISIPCCIHLFGKYDFLAALPKKDGLEIRLGLDRILKSKRLKIAIPLSSRYYKNCLDIKDENKIDEELLGWIKEAYHLKEK